MPSPFPGMDPFLEDQRYFPDLHGSFHVYLRERLQSLLPAPYFAVVNERLIVEVEEQYRRHIEPDTDVLAPAPFVEENGGVAIAVSFQTRTEPILLAEEDSEPLAEKYVEIRTRGPDETERVVTAIEVLSITNKLSGSPGRDLYKQKQREVLRGGIHLVEIDLLRSGEHTTAIRQERLAQSAPHADYHVCVALARRPRRLLLYPFRLEDTLPEIAVPLLPKDGFVPLDLQVVLNRCYDAGPYRRRVRYDLPQLNPPLKPSQRDWAEKRLSERAVV